MSASPFVRVNRAALHALIERASDLIDGIDGADIVEDICPELPRNDMQALWRQAGVATMIGLAIYQNAERFIEHRVYGENGRAS